MINDILYLDYDPESRELGRKFLEQEGYGFRTLNSSKKGTDWFQGEAVVVTDYQLKGVNTGIDVAKALKDDAQVIMYTGCHQDLIETDSGTELPEDTKFVLKGGGYNHLIEEVEQLIE